MQVNKRAWSSEIVLASVGVVMIVVVTLGLYLFLGVRSGRIILSNSSNVENFPNPDARSLLSNVLLATSAILGSVFAVAFGFSQFVISRIARDYSPRMLKSFKKSNRYRVAYLLVFFSTIGSVSLLLFPDMLGQTALYLVAAAITVVFAGSLLAFLSYYNYIYQVVDPVSFSQSVERQIRSSLRDSDYALDATVALADSAIKATIRGGEEESVMAFIESLTNVAFASIPITGTESLTKLVMEGLSRIYAAALAKDDQSITNVIAYKFRKIGLELEKVV
jgi:hypothetical protein